MERLELETVRLPRVVVPIPPLETANRPVTSLEPRLIAPLNKAPPLVDLTGRAEEREEIVVEPKASTVNKAVPVEEATTKGLILPALPTTVKVFWGVVVLIPTRDRAVTLKMELVDEEETLKGSRVVVPWTLKLTADDVALTPATVALSFKMPVLTVLVPIQTVTNPFTPPSSVPP